ncbi:unnamed protein product [Sympodiomycopsis kandeliae]
MENTAGHSPPLNAVQVSNAANATVPPLTAPLSPPMSNHAPPPGASAETAANALLSAFKISLEEVESYLIAMDARVKCEEEYVRALRQTAEKHRENEVKLDTRIGAIASSLPGSSNLPGMRRAWKELQQDTLQQIKCRASYIETLKVHTIAPLRSFHDSQDRIRRRVKEDLKSSLAAYHDMRHVQLKKARRNYEKACETLEALKQHQQAVADQKALLMGPTSKSADLSRSPPTDGSDTHTSALMLATSSSEGGGHPVPAPEDVETLVDPNGEVVHKRSLSFGRRRTSSKARPLSSHSSRASSGEGDPSPNVSSAAQLATSPPDSSSNKKNAGAFFDAFRSKETWEHARKEAAKRTNAILSKMKEGGTGPGIGGSPFLGSGPALDRDINSSAKSRAIDGNGFSSGSSGGLEHSASLSAKHTQFVQSLAIKISKAKRESQDADKAYRRAIFDVETLSLRREKTLAAARTSVLDCRRELHLTSSESWLALNRNWQVLASAELSLARHCEEVLLGLGADGRMESELAILDRRLPVLGGSGLDDEPVPYVNYWHGECKSLLFGVSLVDYDFARNQRRPPQLGPAPVEPPLIVTKCVNFIEDYALHNQGIYRTSAKHTAVQELCAAFEKDEVRFQFDPNLNEPAAVAGVLKQWLRELPNAVIPMPWEERLKLTHSVEEQLNNGFAALKGRIRRLPPINQVTLKTIITHLAKVADHSDTNLMHAKNLSVVFGPVLLSDSSSESHETTSLAAAMEEDNVCEILITYAKDIFSLDRAGAPVLPPLDTRESRQSLLDQSTGALPDLPESSPFQVDLNAAQVETPASDRPLVPQGTSAQAGGLKRSNAVSSTSHDTNDQGDATLTSHTHTYSEPQTAVRFDSAPLDSTSPTSLSAANSPRFPPAPLPLDLPLPKLEVDRQGLVSTDSYITAATNDRSPSSLLHSGKADTGHEA